MTTSTLPAMEYDRVVATVNIDFANAVGTIIYPDDLTVWVRDDRGDHQRDICPTGGRIACRVLPTPPEDLRHDTGGFIDPYWNIQIIADPDNLLPAGYETDSAWTFGPAYPYTVNHAVR